MSNKNYICFTDRAPLWYPLLTSMSRPAYRRETTTTY